MVDVVSIIIAIVSLVGSLVATGFTGWISYYLDETKRKADAKKLVAKYHDPLLLACLDLQSRIWNITQKDLLDMVEEEDRKDLIYVYTCFLIGQFLSWTHILRREAQFLRFSTQKTNRQLAEILDAIIYVFSNDNIPGEDPFMLWRGQQMAIGEIMTRSVSADGQLYCIGYSTFSNEFHTDPEFRKWFVPIERGVDALVEARKRKNRVPTYRLRRLQHLLVDLVRALDVQASEEKKATRGYVESAPGCRCDGCSVPSVKVEAKGAALV